MGEQGSESAKAGEGGRFGATGCRVLVVRGGQKRLHWPGPSSEGQSDLGVRTLSPRILVLQGQEAQEHLLGAFTGSTYTGNLGTLLPVCPTKTYCHPFQVESD